MLVITVVLALAGLTKGLPQTSIRSGTNNGGNNNVASGLCISKNALQSASARTGQEAGTVGIKAGQSPAITDKANFINFCVGKDLTNGEQKRAGSCNGIPMGQLPATKNMISAMIINPQPGKKIAAGQTFNITVQTQHLEAGTFVNPTTNYYTSPQFLNKQGDIVGHCHVTVQNIGRLDSVIPPDPTRFAFFKGIDDAGNGKGLLSATVSEGLPAGVYRVCTMIAAANHQPVAMPVAQRGAQDDCTKFEVVSGGQSGQGNGGDGSGRNGNSGKDRKSADTSNG